MPTLGGKQWPVSGGRNVHPWRHFPGRPFSTPVAGSLRGGAARARWPNRSSKPVRCGNPTLGRFDSGAAPLSRFWRVHADRGAVELRDGGA